MGDRKKAVGWGEVCGACVGLLAVPLSFPLVVGAIEAGDTRQLVGLGVCWLVFALIGALCGGFLAGGGGERLPPRKRPPDIPADVLEAAGERFGSAALP